MWGLNTVNLLYKIIIANLMKILLYYNSQFEVSSKANASQ